MTHADPLKTKVLRTSAKKSRLRNRTRTALGANRFVNPGDRRARNRRPYLNTIELRACVFAHCADCVARTHRNGRNEGANFSRCDQSLG